MVVGSTPGIAHEVQQSKCAKVRCFSERCVGASSRNTSSRVVSKPQLVEALCSEICETVVILKT